jgi:AraC family transcriptional regulator
MNQPTTAPLASPRLVTSEGLLLFGLAQRCERLADPAIPLLWSKFLPHFGQIPGQIGNVAYGAIYNSGDSSHYDYLCAVAMTAFPNHPPEFTRLRIPAQTYAVFEHRGHISTIAGTFKAIWGQGLAGLQALTAPTLEVYDERFDGRTGLGGLEIWVPVKAA